MPLCFLLAVMKIMISKNKNIRMKGCVSINLTTVKVLCEKYDKSGDNFRLYMSQVPLPS